MKTIITVGRLIDEARGLVDDPGTNLEYERGLVELITRAAGTSHDYDGALYELVFGVERPERYKEGRA